MAKKLEPKRNNKGSYRASDGTEITDYEKYVHYEELLQKRSLGTTWLWFAVPLLLGVVWWWL